MEESVLADERDLVLFNSDEDDDYGMLSNSSPTRTAQNLPRPQNGENREYALHHQNDRIDNERKLCEQITQQLQPVMNKKDPVEMILEDTQADLNEEISVIHVIQQLQQLPPPLTSNIRLLIHVLQELKQQHVPKDAIMSIWFKLTHPNKPTRARSAAHAPVIRSRVLESQRKQAECDLKLLQNRISLLQHEESKAWKKIVQTKDRAQELLEIRQANVEKHLQQSTWTHEKQKQTEQIKQKQSSIKKESFLKKKKAEIQLVSKKYQDVEHVKTERKRLKEEKERQQRLSVETARKKRSRVRQEEEKIRLKKQQEQEQTKQKIAVRYLTKVIDEERKMKLHQRQVHEMEEQERLLIARLQGTQLIQQQACQVLEQALVQRPMTARHRGRS